MDTLRQWQQPHESKHDFYRLRRTIYKLFLAIRCCCAAVYKSKIRHQHYTRWTKSKFLIKSAHRDESASWVRNEWHKRVHINTHIDMLCIQKLLLFVFLMCSTFLFSMNYCWGRALSSVVSFRLSDSVSVFLSLVFSMAISRVTKRSPKTVFAHKSQDVACLFWSKQRWLSAVSCEKFWGRVNWICITFGGSAVIVIAVFPQSICVFLSPPPAETHNRYIWWFFISNEYFN